MNPICTNPWDILIKQELIKKGLIKQEEQNRQGQQARQHRLLPDAFPPSPPVISPPKPAPSVEDFLRMAPIDPMRDAERQEDDVCFQTNSCRPNDLEKATLKFTFGEEVGQDLIENMRVGTDTNDIETENLVLVPTNYDPDNLDMLAEHFIYGATRVWQQRTGRHTGEEGGIHYCYPQLYNLDLNTWQHAGAVRDWFYVNYGIETGVVDSEKNLKLFNQLWQSTLKILLIEGHRSAFSRDDVRVLQRVVNNHYGCVIKEIRDADLLPKAAG